MSDDSDQEKTEQPTEKKLRESREKGEVPRSRDLSGALVVLAGVAALMSGGEQALVHARRIFSLGMHYSRDALFSDDLPGRTLHAVVYEALGLFAPVALATMLATLAAPLLLGGMNFSAQALQPKFERLDPVKGLGRIFAMRGLVELGKALLKLLFIGAVLALLLRHWQGELQATGRGSVLAGIAQSIGLLGRAALWFGAMLALIGGIDAIYQKFDHAKNLRMTRQEIRDEMKESEGNPEMKGRIRQVQQAQARRRMMEDLPRADVVVVNPTHFAVALRYDEGRTGAPRVIAKGVDVLAQQIRLVAGSHRIPLVEAPPLARALYATTELGREIPAALYVAVAQVLAYVYQLKQATAQGETPPAAPTPEVDPDLMGPYRE
ncbi:MULTISPECIES: flagellar biosynthesis protein FlhB [Rhodanobacter]|uniref:Flagellar biosynthetic protein FlhB n=1 Tax=Rhodanobacter denitrificans TaxID=666685 RepID=U3GKL9_9GAMM|nr:MULTISPECIES: flagellar biosynthesis protein FlhB [Rhodanobacter]AGG90059.1 flagellar biosynthetic protein FlhB [Rhodanobacter denitrificans]EIM04681.1 flagellar biosynthetic protein FlhB [Rhodanobacter denitrificans]KZC20578.1 flagellar biosynthetic protein FlhB [Rhodanobacter denitrificans]UJJ50172.1 flagellar biosynthesis protein FlhB [Rhodanobacter denitrificans]UJJ57643.1 flagellar biosynthesis protein FlhB [Rhodanobacter denitrificans]